MTTLIYVALDLNGLVMAHFLKADDCSAYCERGVKYTNMAFNLANRDREPAPLVGTIYRA